MKTEPEPAARPKYKRRKAAILRTAVDVINTKGVQGMTLGDVAEKLGLVPTAVNYYFKGREDLAAACFMQAIGKYNSLMARSDLVATPEEKLRAFLEDFADYMAAVQTGCAEPVAAFNDVRAISDPAVNAAYTDMFRRIRRIFTLKPISEPVRLQQNARTHLLISQVFWAVLWLQNYDPADYRRMIGRLFDLLVNGLATQGTAWAPVELAAPQPAVETPGGSREAFLRAATEMLNEHGYVNASVSRIAARLKLTKGSFYHHIQAKDALVEQCFDRTLEVMRSSQLAADASTRTGFDNLASLTAFMIRRDVSGEVPLLRTSALTTVPQEMQAQLVRRFDRFSARLASVFSDGVADGSIRPVDTNVAAQAITALINASAELHHWAPGVTEANAAEIYACPLFTGIFRPGLAAAAAEPSRGAAAEG